MSALSWKDAAKALGLSRSGYFRLINLYHKRLGHGDGTPVITKEDLPILERAVALVRSGKVRSYEEAFSLLRLERVENLSDLRATVRDLALQVERLDEKGVQALRSLLGVVLRELDQVRQDLYQVRLVLQATLYPMAEQDAEVRPHLRPLAFPVSKDVLAQGAKPRGSEGDPKGEKVEAKGVAGEKAPSRKKRPWYME